MTTLNDYQQDETRVNSRTLTPGQRRALSRIVRYYRDWNDHNGVTSVRFTLTRPFGTFPSFVITTRRSDCGEFSPRAVYTKMDASGSIGPRGGITLYRASNGLNDETKYVAKMLRAHTQ